MTAAAVKPVIEPLSPEWIDRAYRRYLISVETEAGVTTTANAWWFTFDPITGEQRPTVMLSAVGLDRQFCIVNEIAYDPRDGSEFIRRLVLRDVGELTARLRHHRMMSVLVSPEASPENDPERNQ